jgi:DNA-binding response OmpR family regulator
MIRADAPFLPVLFITGYAGSAKFDELDAGMQVLAKPFRLPALMAKVEAMLSAARPGD